MHHWVPQSIIALRHYNRQTFISDARARFPDAEWLVGDMRALALHRRFNGALAWDSFFHLHMND